MKKKTIIWVLSGVAALVLLVVLLTKVVLEPWLEGKIRTAIDENSGAYLVEVESVDVSVLQAGVELENIRLRTKGEMGGSGALSGTIEALTVKGISVFKALLRKDIDIRKVAYLEWRASALLMGAGELTANDAKATGDMQLRYRGLDFEVVDKLSGEATGTAERVKSMVADWVVKDWNPMPGQEMRQGVIDYERDPEKFLFNYMVKSLTSGIKTSVTKE